MSMGRSEALPAVSRLLSGDLKLGCYVDPTSFLRTDCASISARNFKISFTKGFG